MMGTVLPASPELCADVKAVHLRQHHVEQDEIGVAGQAELQARLAVERLERLIALARRLNFRISTIARSSSTIRIFFFSSIKNTSQWAPQRLRIVVFQLPAGTFAPAERAALYLHERPSRAVCRDGTLRPM